MGYDTGLADRLRAAGLDVVEVAGWQTRGSSSFSPRGSVNHHTAGPASGATPSLNTIVYGRPDLAGPLANVMQSREPDGNDRAYVVAAGRANHAGEGGWKGLSGNSSVWGLEIEHTGIDPLPQHRQEIAARIHAAMFTGDPAMVCQHFEWCEPPGRKIDAATNVNGDQFRQLVANAGDDDLPYSEAQLRKIVGDAVNSVFTTNGSGARQGTRDCAAAGVEDMMSKPGSKTRVGIRECSAAGTADEMSTPGSLSRTGVRDCSAAGADDSLGDQLDTMQAQLDQVAEVLGIDPPPPTRARERDWPTLAVLAAIAIILVVLAVLVGTR